jgi:hypothetical protein
LIPEIERYFRPMSSRRNRTAAVLCFLTGAPVHAATHFLRPPSGRRTSGGSGADRSGHCCEADAFIKEVNERLLSSRRTSIAPPG